MRLALVAAFAIGCAAAPPTSKPPAPAPEIFRFHVGLWANLHQVLIHEALLPRPGFDGPKSLAHKSVAPVDGLPAAELAPWRDALAFYDRRFTTRNTFEDELMNAVRGFTAAENDMSFGFALAPEWKTVIVGAAPVYRAHFWTAHESADKKYVDAIRPLVAQHGEWFVKRLAALYETAWPSAPVDVEVTPVVPPFGASTMGEPPFTGVHAPLVTVSSLDPGYSGESGLEMIFHEGSHLLVDKVQAMLADSAKRQNKSPPPQLWHFVLFYTAGHVAKERLGPSYVPYAERPQNRVFLPDLTNVLAILERAWQPYLDGRSNLEASVDAVVASF